jgi:ABC-type molybdate transport system substrate-binding protein
MKLSFVAAAVVGLSVLMSQTAHSAEIRVFCTGAARGAYEELAPQFEKATGHKLITHYGLPSELLRKLDGASRPTRLSCRSTSSA